MARLRAHLCDASGGLVYHWRALRYRHALWQPFIAQVARWLSAWQTPARELVVVGPSAGYTLDASFLARFARVTVLEPDPLARRLLHWRFPEIAFAYGDMDCFASLDGPYALAGTYPQAAILFANVLGQKLLDLPPGWVSVLQTALAGHAWATYHDVLATAQAPRARQARQFDPGTALEDVLAGFWSGGELAVYDHGSFNVLPVQDYMPWSITPRQHHLVGWKSCMPDGSSSIMPGNSGIGGKS
ncbi:MAG: hypothetical protein H6R19_989 [Proteobacteria bacterium]|nr:hypothetical protein [Pseudomonadota bacterium]